MIALLRFLLMGFVVLTVVYVSVSLYSRAMRRQKLRRHWDEKIGTGDRDAFVRKGLALYDRSLRRRLILGVYIIPMIVVGTIVYIVNYT
ncbi:hypothetical protein NHN26_07625 [Rhodovulum tesquicola]|uniref:Cation/multidrug efflux pump n=1 Tax=Rhodovulum steppense TaxID=540251 RepID=A0A4R1YXL8_9RHOB|nr:MULTISPECIES: hypothetical protein [Rhodovulum]MCO8145094.1 hypothetical protein [Rhodovulum tesquicola]TCM85746.1 hypothetical protein EV216_10646 [Rhodovulum steppense]